MRKGFFFIIITYMKREKILFLFFFSLGGFYRGNLVALITTESAGEP